MCSLNPHTSESCFGFDESTGTIIKFYKYEGNDSKNDVCPKDVIIPNKIKGVDVVTIGGRVFYPDAVGVKIESVVIPSTVKTIKEGAFRYNGSLKKVTLNKGLEVIESGAFEFHGTKGAIKEITIPSTIKMIGNEAFQNQNIESLDLSECTNLTSIGLLAFANNNLENIILPQNQDILMYGAFNNNKMREDEAYIYKHTKDGIDYSEIVSYAGSLKDITIPSEKKGIGLKKIGNGSFYKVNLTNVVIPEGVEIINDRSFWDNKLTNIIFHQV